MNAPLAPRLSAEAKPVNCAHCGQRVPEGARDAFCCRGCRAVAGLIRTTGLERYYDLRRGPGVPVAETSDAPRDRKWLEPIVARVKAAEGPSHVALDLQGVHCSACVWLAQTLFEREGQAGAIEINPALGRADLRIDARFPLEHFVETIESFGYRFGPATDAPERLPSDGLLLRAGICLALAGNGMMLSAAIHLGLRGGVLHRWASDLAFGASLIAMSIGGPIFARSAWAGLRRGVLHLDLPIALGMGLAFFGSVASYLSGGGANYVDTLTAFVALMLLGRWLQVRILERNQRELLQDGGYEGLLCRRLVGDAAELVPCARVDVGDVLLVSPGDLVPIRATLLDDPASFSFDWIDGESRPRTISRDGSVPSGAMLASESAVRVRAEEAFSASEVMSLLRGGRAEDASGRTLAGIPKNIGGIYVGFVLVAAVAAGVATWLTGHDLVHTLEVTTATLVVTCPCAFGIAVPLAYEIVQSRLRRSGVFVRRPSLFERALEVDTVIFDKTGTLTTGRLELASRLGLDALDPDACGVLYDLAARSNHPKSRAVAHAIELGGRASLDPSRSVFEVRGSGMVSVTPRGTYRLGAPRWALTDGNETADLAFSLDGELIVALETQEEIRPETGDEVRRLERDGFEVYVLSGDGPERCTEVASQLGISDAHVLSHRSPEEKEDWIEAHRPARLMMIGDGLNDARALAAAGCSGTPSIERPFTASRCDFYFVTPGLEPVAQVLHASRRLAQIVRSDLVIAFLYNTVAVGLCIAGLMHPWLAAILMPASSLGTIAWTAFALRGDRRWKS